MMGHAASEENGMAHACRGLRGAITVLCVSLALLVAASSGGVPVALAAGGGGASSCGGGGPTTVPTNTPGGPSILLSHTTGPVGMAEIVTGAVWPAGVQVSLDFAEQAPDRTYYLLHSSVVSATVHPDGTFAMPSFFMPDANSCGATAGPSPNSKVVYVVHTPDNAYAAQAEFTYTAQPTLGLGYLQHATAGAQLTLTGAFWEPNETMAVSFSSSAPNVNEVAASATPVGTLNTRTDGYGGLNASYTLPATLLPRLNLYIQATAKGPLYGTVISQQIQMQVFPAHMPTLTLSRSSGTVNDAITVRGANWYPGDTVTITYCRWQTILSDLQVLRCDPSQSQTLTAVTVDAAGHFSTSIHLPTSAQNGPITIQALVPNDVFGLAVYAQAAPYTIVPPPPPWSAVHPRQAFALSILKPALPALALALILLGVYLWRRRSRTARSTGVALPERDRFTRV